MSKRVDVIGDPLQFEFFEGGQDDGPATVIITKLDVAKRQNVQRLAVALLKGDKLRAPDLP